MSPCLPFPCLLHQISEMLKRLHRRRGGACLTLSLDSHSLSLSLSLSFTHEYASAYFPGTSSARRLMKTSWTSSHEKVRERESPKRTSEALCPSRSTRDAGRHSPTLPLHSSLASLIKKVTGMSPCVKGKKQEIRKSERTSATGHRTSGGASVSTRTHWLPSSLLPHRRALARERGERDCWRSCNEGETCEAYRRAREVSESRTSFALSICVSV